GKGAGFELGRSGEGSGESWVRWRVDGRVGRSCCKFGGKWGWGSIEDFVSFREMITSQLLYLRGSSYETLFVLSSSNRGRLLRFLI
nr:hypothetical protein [Tanacetum cinerariifolium]